MGEMAAIGRVELAPEAPETWLENGFEPLYAMSWRDYEDVQFAALRLRFERFRNSVAAPT